MIGGTILSYLLVLVVPQSLIVRRVWRRELAIGEPPRFMVQPAELANVRSEPAAIPPAAHKPGSTDPRWNRRSTSAIPPSSGRSSRGVEAVGVGVVAIAFVGNVQRVGVRQTRCRRGMRSWTSAWSGSPAGRTYCWDRAPWSAAGGVVVERRQRQSAPPDGGRPTPLLSLQIVSVGSTQ